MRAEDLAGVDFGRRYAGTTRVCVLREGKLQWWRCRRGQDADAWLPEVLGGVRAVFLDAPLSLPGVYCHPERYGDYFFRVCDRLLGGMSPLFLGGLTARAIQLKDRLRSMELAVYETYPRALERRLGLSRGEQTPEGYLQQLYARISLPPPGMAVEDWHDVDALLAWTSAWRWLKGQAEIYGEPEEGVVYV